MAVMLSQPTLYDVVLAINIYNNSYIITYNCILFDKRSEIKAIIFSPTLSSYLYQIPSHPIKINSSW